MAIFRYAAFGILRNRRRTFSSILGVLLAVTFIAGSFIAIDSSARSSLGAILATVPGDLSFSATVPNAGNGSAYGDAALTVSGVTNASVYRTWSLMFTSSVAPGSTTYATLDGVQPGHLPSRYRGAAVSGTLDLPNGTIAVSSDLAASLSLRRGDPVTLVNQFYNGSGVHNYTVNLTVSALFTLPLQTGYYPPPAGYYYGPGPYFSSSSAVNLRDFQWILTQLHIVDYNPQVLGEIWIDRARFVNPYDVAGTTAAMQRLQRQLTSALNQVGGIVQVSENLSGPLANFNAQMGIQRLLYLLLSAPVIFLGLYLGAVGVDLGHAERRRELGVLKTRGASRGQIAGLLILESILSGLLAAAIGLAVGVALSRFLLASVNPFGVTYVPAYGDVFLSTDTVVTVALLSVFFMGIVSYRSSRRTASLPLVETLHYYAPGETRIHYSPVTDILLVAYGVTAYVGSALVRTGTPGMFTFLFGLIFILSLPVAPVLLIVGGTRLATRATGRVYSAMARVCRLFTKNLEYIVSRNLSRNPRRASSVAIIIALGLGFGMLAVSALSSQQVYLERLTRANVGADMSVAVASARFLPNGTLAAADTGFAANLSKVSGVAGISHVQDAPQAQPLYLPQSPYYGGPSYVEVTAVDPASYFDVARPESFFFEPSTEAQVAAALRANNTVAVTLAYADGAAIQVGDTLPIQGTFYSNATPHQVSVSTKVGAILRYLPGSASGVYGSPVQVYGSFSTFAPFFNASLTSGYYSGGEHYLVSLAPGTDWKATKTAILALGAQSVSVYQEQLDQFVSNPFTGAILGFMKIEIAFIVVILTAGLALIVYAASLERDVEFAGIIARGASGWQTAGLLVGEAFSIMLLGLVVGTGVGLTTSYFFVQYLFFTGTSTAEAAVPYLFSFPLEGLLLLVAAPAAMLLAAVLVSWRTARMNVARVLKMRGG